MSTNVLTNTFLTELLEKGHLISTGVKGVYGKGKEMNLLLKNIEDFISGYGRTEDTEIMMFPPIMNQEDIQKAEYLKSFPHLLGNVQSFQGNENDHKQMITTLDKGKDWSKHFSNSGVVMTPAACYPVYSQLAKTKVPLGGRTIEVASFCYRHEPSNEPTRMQSFRMLEFIKVGSSDEVKVWRKEWLEKAQALLDLLQVNYEVVIANDPFFGSGGRLLKINQNHLELKYEITIPINDEEAPTAVISSNYHQDHFAKKHQILTETEDMAHTSCIGFGIERLGLALLKHHGLDTKEWPANLKTLLNL
ncbi:amino acid--[acyl-carrier-protein] ligase [Priestia megaterium]|uniref:amino acid--[acyl-carrier-protein] ligase n=1 Tax=Priestia megaterium TaxID=1404 RepID=UPI0020792E9D|nr:amino acid--[acyl-carrier-protein] ligase [Priestia megaterium]USL45326.1 amino acid--[acyl-carrier-protein] ligase [Priestia megaterium]